MSALEKLFDLTRVADPYRSAPENLPALQLEAARERVAERRRQPGPGMGTCAGTIDSYVRGAIAD